MIVRIRFGVFDRIRLTGSPAIVFYSQILDRKCCDKIFPLQIPVILRNELLAKGNLAYSPDSREPCTLHINPYSRGNDKMPKVTFLASQRIIKDECLPKY